MNGVVGWLERVTEGLFAQASMYPREPVLSDPPRPEIRVCSFATVSCVGQMTHRLCLPKYFYDPAFRWGGKTRSGLMISRGRVDTSKMRRDVR